MVFATRLGRLTEIAKPYQTHQGQFKANKTVEIGNESKRCQCFELINTRNNILGEE